jgi:hypothetical protein
MTRHNWRLSRGYDRPCRPWCAPPCFEDVRHITEADADAIRAVFNQEGELSAAIELRRRFPGVTDNAKARACARSARLELLDPKRRRSRE